MELGTTVMTVGIAKAMERDFYFKTFVLDSFERYERHDWGELCEEDKDENDRALKEGNRVFASYNLPPYLRGLFPDDKIWIITEWDRSVTTILFPEEY